MTARPTVHRYHRSGREDVLSSYFDFDGAMDVCVTPLTDRVEAASLELAEHLADAVTPGSVVLSFAKPEQRCESCGMDVSPHSASHVLRWYANGARHSRATCWRNVFPLIEGLNGRKETA